MTHGHAGPTAHYNDALTRFAKFKRAIQLDFAASEPASNGRGSHSRAPGSHYGTSTKEAGELPSRWRPQTKQMARILHQRLEFFNVLVDTACTAS